MWGYSRSCCQPCTAAQSATGSRLQLGRLISQHVSKILLGWHTRQLAGTGIHPHHLHQRLRLARQHPRQLRCYTFIPAASDSCCACVCLQGCYRLIEGLGCCSMTALAHQHACIIWVPGTSGPGRCDCSSVWPGKLRRAGVDDACMLCAHTQAAVCLGRSACCLAAAYQRLAATASSCGSTESLSACRGS